MSIQSTTGPSQLWDVRLRAVCDLGVPAARQVAGRHGFDGVVQDLSPSGVAAGLRALSVAPADPQPHPHDEAQLAASVTAAGVRFGELELHRVNPLWHILNLDLSCYDREYAPAVERRGARDRHERARLRELLERSCRRIDAHAPIEATIDALRADHPTSASLLSVTTALVDEVIAWTSEAGLVPYLDGECEVAPMPESQRIAAAGLFGAAPNEADAPSRFYVTAPDPALPAAEQQRWLASYFNRATLPVIAIHEVAPGHFAHSRAWRRAAGEVRRTLFSEGFSEGWAHYTEELALDEGFRSDDPAFGAGVALDGLRRVARLRSALGVHSGELTVHEAAAAFGRDAYLPGPGAYSEARRGLLDPGYGRYTWGKFAVLDLRERARARWGAGFSLPRFHRALLDLGSPPLGLLGTALDGG